MEAIVPWAEKKVLAGIDSERTFNLPIKGHLEYNRKNVDKYLKLTVTPTLSKKVNKYLYNTFKWNISSNFFINKMQIYSNYLKPNFNVL